MSEARNKVEIREKSLGNSHPLPSVHLQSSNLQGWGNSRETSQGAGPKGKENPLRDLEVWKLNVHMKIPKILPGLRSQAWPVEDVSNWLFKVHQERVTQSPERGHLPSGLIYPSPHMLTREKGPYFEKNKLRFPHPISVIKNKKMRNTKKQVTWTSVKKGNDLYKQN